MSMFLLEATSSAAADAGAGSALVMPIMLVLMFAIMYFFMIRPQRKKQKAEEKMRNSIQIGDEILTIGGFYGRVVSIKEDSLVIESAGDHSKQKIARWAVQQNMTIHEEA